MDEPMSDDFVHLEAEVAKNPTSEHARAALLEALSAEPDRFDDPRRFELIEWFLRHNPRHHICSTPFMRVDPETAPAQLWLDLGRMSEDAHERLSAFERAREAGNSLPNLLVRIAMTAIKAGDHRRADQAARELMQLVENARAQFGDKLDWRERGSALWKRAREICPTNEAASELTDAIAQHAYRKHWGHTVLGLLACHGGDLDRAVVHLHASADIHPEYRLSACGPSPDLLRELCARGRWDDGVEYLRTWDQISGDPRVREWMVSVTERRLPEAD
jgi:hypothetical protein